MSTVDDESGQDRIDKGHSDDARSADDASSHDVPGLLDAAVAATRAANSAVAVSITLDADRIAHTSASNELACAMNSTAGAVEEPLEVWWGSRECYRQLFTDGLIDLKVLRTIRDHTLGAPPCAPVPRTPPGRSSSRSVGNISTPSPRAPDAASPTLRRAQRAHTHRTARVRAPAAPHRAQPRRPTS